MGKVGTTACLVQWLKIIISPTYSGQGKPCPYNHIKLFYHYRSYMQLSQRKNPRTSRYDYSVWWMYFVTTCTENREWYFGEIHDKKMILNEIWQICDKELQIMLNKRPSVEMHEYVIMPNHVHLLFYANECNYGDNCRDDGLPRPMIENHYSTDIQGHANVTTQTLGSIIWWRKSAVTKKCGEQWREFSRQSRYHDHIVRDETDYENIKHYIQRNPQNRAEDQFWTEI